MRIPRFFERMLRPPAAGASKLERLRFVRRCALAQIPGVALVWLVLLSVATLPDWALIVAGIGTLLTFQTILHLSWRIRQLRRS
jgi:hypothetical protein